MIIKLIDGKYMVTRGQVVKIKDDKKSENKRSEQNLNNGDNDLLTIGKKCTI